MPAENITITAKWTINQYTITFNTDGGTIIEPIKQDYNTEIVRPANPEKTGYTFTRWDKEIPATMPAEDITITANYTINTYTVTYKDGENGRVFPDIEFKVNYNEPTPEFGEDPLRDNYVFSGWDIDPSEKVTADAIYTATWKTDEIGDGEPNGIADEQETYKLIIKHEFNDRKVTKEDIEIEKDYNNRTITVAPEEVEHYTATESETTVTIGDDNYLTKTIVFHYIRNNQEVSYRIVGDVIPNPEPIVPETKVYDEEDLVEIVDALEVQGYTFSGWMINDEPATNFTMGNAKVEITGSFTRNTTTEYKINYYYQNIEDGSYEEPTEIVTRTGTTDETVSLLAQEKMPDVV
jgi:hypothetical protein